MTLSTVWSRWSSYIIFAICLICIIFLLGGDLNPFSSEMFAGHDETQAGRIQQFVYSLQQGQIPPRIAPDMSFGLGFPIFNYYAPTAYWFTSSFVLIGFSIITAIKLSYLLAIITGFIGMVLLLRLFFDKYAAYLGAAAYVTSPYLAVDIFVRANLAEAWFFALFPLGLYALYTVNKKRLLATVVILSLLFTSHNVLSLLTVAICIVMSLLIKQKRLALLTVILGLLASAYFLIPAVAELSLVQAQARATTTQYADHFLCLSQLWSSMWGFAGSAPGCTADGMSFQIGKFQILLGIAGLIFFAYHTIKKQQQDNQNLFRSIAALTILSIFMVTPASQLIWDLFKPILSLFQFPWRFLMFVVFGLSFYTAYFADHVKVPFKQYGIVLGIIIIFGFNQKFFYSQNISTTEFSTKYLSQEYIATSLAYKAAEYIPYTVDYATWKSLESKATASDFADPIVRTGKEELLPLKTKGFDRLFSVKSPEAIRLNIHYAPYWQITQNNEVMTPTKFDKLGRPYIKLSGSDFDTIRVQYKQTNLETISNLITIITLLSLILFSIKSIKWTKLIIKKI
ncbi:MAG: hypothetical protein ACEQSA_04440 [Weeksellaceae bacterium]